MAAIYHAPTDIAVAIDLLAQMNEKTVVVAGGTEVTRRLRRSGMLRAVARHRPIA